MKRKITNIILSLGVFAAVAVVPMVATTNVYAGTPSPPPTGIDKAKEGVTNVGGDNTKSLPAFIKNIINILLFILGFIAVLMIIIGGIRYVTSAGDSSAVSGAKDTVLYAVIGLVIALMAFAIVNFVLNSL